MVVADSREEEEAQRENEDGAVTSSSRMREEMSPAVTKAANEGETLEGETPLCAVRNVDAEGRDCVSGGAPLSV